MVGRIKIHLKQPSNVVNFYRNKGWFREAIIETYKELGPKAKKDMQQKIDQSVHISGTGAVALSKSIYYRIDTHNARLIVGTTAPHAAAQEFGATFKKFPHSESLKKWAKQAGIPYARLQRKLKRDGLPPIGFVRHAQFQMTKTFGPTFMKFMKKFSEQG